MKKFILSCIVFLSMLCCAVDASAQSSMTDKQVLEYVKKGLTSGRSQQELMQELVLKGVDRAQLERVKKLYEKERMSGGDKSSNASGDRLHTQNADYMEDDTKSISKKVKNKKKNDPRMKGYQDQGLKALGIGVDEEDEGFEFSPEDEFFMDEEEEKEKKDSIIVFGRNIFKNRSLEFTPNPNIGTPKNYVLGPGDEVIVDIFGVSQNTIREVISPDGFINVEMLGPVFLAGKTVEAANSYLKNKLSTIYEGLIDGDDKTAIQLSLGQIRTVQVSIVGDVTDPGTYTVSSLSTVFHAMFQAGGVEENGTIRNIKVMRNNKLVATVDVYDLLVDGSRKSDVRVEDGDVIVVEPYVGLVKVTGAVKREMYFEMKEGETVEDVLKYAGGFAQSAYRENVSVIGQNGGDSIVSVVDAPQFGSFVLHNGDEVQVRKMEARFTNRIDIAGAVYLPGRYELSSEVNSVRKLINKAGGLMPEAFTQRAVIHRMREDMTLEKMAVDIEGVLSGKLADVPLRNNDSIYINSFFELHDFGTMTINGEVATPGIFPFAENTTIQDLIVMAGGLLRSASSVRVDVSRKVTDPESVVALSDIATYFVFALENGLAVDGADKFVLEPYDVVTVRRSPSFVDNRIVTVSGEVNFPGKYNMSKREERVSDLLKKAGDVTDFAYVKGARLTRQMSADEILLYENIVEAVSNESDSVKKKKADPTYLVSFDMEDALKNPGGVNDIVLREGDVLDVPVYNNTIRIGGAVQMATTITYRKGYNKRQLVDAAGGYAKRAYRHKAFVVYMNGQVARLKRRTKIEPGCQVFIPKKEKTAGQTQQILSIASTAASLGLTAASISNLLK